MAHARRRWRGHVARGHTGPHWSTRTAVRAATWQGGWRVKGPRVSGPWLECWGGNAKALPHYTLSTRDFRLFNLCETMFPQIFLLQVMWTNHNSRLRSQSVARVDLSPRDLHQDTCVKKIISEALDGRHVAWRGGINLHQTIAIHRDFGTSKGNTWTHLSARWRSDGSNDSALMIVTHDRSSIMARLPRDRGQITVQFGRRSLLIDGPALSCDHRHQIYLLTGSNSPKIARKFCFKNRCTPLYHLKSCLIREAIKKI